MPSSSGEPRFAILDWQLPFDKDMDDLVQDTSKPLFVLLVSSSGRSGSTMTAELLGTRNNSVLFFEPIWMNRKITCFLNGTCIPQFLEDIAHCEYDQDFEDWLRLKGIFLRYYHPEASRCFQHPKEGNSSLCKRDLDMRGLCRTSTVRIAKLIRSRLSWLEGLLSDASLNVKVVHLSRDPRGAFSSLAKLGWMKSPAKQCTFLDTDLKDFDRMVKIYPTKLYRIQLETLCLEPYGTVAKLFYFLYGNSTIPEEAEKFMERHMNATKSKSGNMNTVKNSSVEYQAWRWKISESVLTEVEREESCQSAIDRLGHVIFGSIEEAQNESISLMKTAK